MAVTLKDVEHIAHLARLEFSAEEKQKLLRELNGILAYVEQLNTLNTDTVDPLTHVVEPGNVFRDDVVKPGVTTDEALKNAPAHTDEFFKVPRAIGGRE